ncbi:MAG: hypothetical protein JWL90_2100 [Chthoniobacteraceae bacterium]|nr:hypothetical protein [Chthoniobacteraceae bacterium]
MASIADFLSVESLRKLEQLAVRSRYITEGSMSGGHKSPLKGQSVEFADRRAYTKGDNLRHLDWKVFGRTERYVIRQYEEETSLRVHVVLDASGSMAYGSPENPTKYQYACRVAVALGYIVGKQHDSIGLTVYDNELREMVPARSGARHLRLFVDRLAAHQPRNVTDTGKALHALAEMISRRGLIVLMSDCFDDPDALFNAIAHFKKKMHDVILLQILDPAELDLSMSGIAEFIDMETGETLEIDPVAAREAYKHELQKAIDALREKCAVMNVDYRLVATSESFEDFIHQYLLERRRMSL